MNLPPSEFSQKPCESHQTIDVVGTQAAEQQFGSAEEGFPRARIIGISSRLDIQRPSTQEIRRESMKLL
jgi:hypothetical protein